MARKNLTDVKSDDTAEFASDGTYDGPQRGSYPRTLQGYVDWLNDRAIYTGRFDRWRVVKGKEINGRKLPDTMEPDHAASDRLMLEASRRMFDERRRQEARAGARSHADSMPTNGGEG